MTALNDRKHGIESDQLLPARAFHNTVIEWSHDAGDDQNVEWVT